MFRNFIKILSFFVSISNSIELNRDYINKYLEGDNINIFILILKK